MRVLQARSAPRYRRPGVITSYLLASPRTADGKNLTATLVDIDPGGEQRIHDHEPEQLYFILEGQGVMTVGEERADVGAGDCILIPSGAMHGIRNSGGSRLRYFSAAAPSFTDEQLSNYWPLGSEDEGV